MYIKDEEVYIQTAADRPQQDNPANCVVAQQYSSPTFVS